jgi:hypothetical protein
MSKKLALQGVLVSHESIYRHPLDDRKSGGFLWKQLRINGTRRYRRRNKVGRKEKIKGRVDIENRPPEVAPVETGKQILFKGPPKLGFYCLFMSVRAGLVSSTNSPGKRV